jgi:hypothetical protein
MPTCAGCGITRKTLDAPCSVCGHKPALPDPDPIPLAPEKTPAPTPRLRPASRRVRRAVAS